MKSLIRLTDYDRQELYDIFKLTDELRQGNYSDVLKGKTIVMFFPNSSIRTRVTFEKGIYLLGGQPILFPVEALEKREEIRDVCGYLNNWADAVIVRYKDIHLLEEMEGYLDIPVINAMTSVNHPCEMLADLYALSKLRKDITKDEFLYVGASSNIGLAWREAAEVVGFHLEQCCAEGYEMDGCVHYHTILEAVQGKDIICTDSLSPEMLAEFSKCQVTSEAMNLANEGAVLNPCPPFYRGEEVSAEVLETDYFVGYEFKKYLLEVQQAIMLYCLNR